MWYLTKYNPIQAGSIDGTDSEPHDSAIDRASHSTYRPPLHLKTNPKCTLFVGRLSFDTGELALKQHFEKYGTISTVTIIRNQVTGLSQGYGFLTFASEKEAHSAYKNANRTTLDDHVILVDFERSRVMKGWIPRRLGGGFGGKKESGQLRFGARDRPFKQPTSSQIRIPYEQKFSDNWTEYSAQEKSKRVRSPSSNSHSRREYPQRRRSSSPTNSISSSSNNMSRRHSRKRSPSSDSRRHHQHKLSSYSHKHRHKYH